MNYGNILWDNDQKVDRLISKILRVATLILASFAILGMQGFFEVSSDLFFVIMWISCGILLVPTILVDFLKYRKSWVKYMIITCTNVVALSILCCFKDMTFLLIVIPMILATLYFDGKLGAYSIILFIINLLICEGVKAFTVIAQSGEDGFPIYIDETWDLVSKAALFLFICYAEVGLIRRSSRVFKNAFHNSDELKRNRDGLDVIVDNTDILFRARNYAEIVSIILFLIKNLFETIEGSSCHLRGYVAIQEDKNKYFGIDETVNTAQFIANENEVYIKLEDSDYNIPINETNDSSTVFVNKNLLTMHFYVDSKLFAFVVLHIDLEDTDEVLNKLVRVLYRNIHLAINNIKLSNDMYETQEELVRAFSEISESKSGQTGKHIKRVSEYMKIMAEALDLDQSEKDSLMIASMMHDIGKLLIPESILEKPGKLTASEFEIMKTHVKLGYKLLEFSPGRIMEIARVIALQHHEKWDGTGYLGMKGAEIDYYSRIMAVVDVVDALMSKRSYKERWSIEDAYNEIVSQSGRHFDPGIVEMFKEHFDEFVEVLNNYPDCEKSAS